MERWTGVNLDRNGLTSLFRRKSRDLLGVETLKCRLFVQTFCGSDLGMGEPIALRRSWAPPSDRARRSAGRTGLTQGPAARAARPGRTDRDEQI